MEYWTVKNGVKKQPEPKTETKEVTILWER